MTSSCAVIWKQPSPSTQTTVASGRAALAPTAAGIPYPIVPSPPEVMKLRGVSESEVLHRPHLVLPDAGRDDHVGAGGEALEPLEHALRLQPPAVLAVAERELLAPGADLVEPGLGRRHALGPVARDLGRERRERRLERADDRDVRAAQLRDLGRVDVEVDDGRAGGERRELAR